LIWAVGPEKKKVKMEMMMIMMIKPASWSILTNEQDISLKYFNLR
jgi:hypothetical protein